MSSMYRSTNYTLGTGVIVLYMFGRYLKRPWPHGTYALNAKDIDSVSLYKTTLELFNLESLDKGSSGSSLTNR